MNDEPIYDFSGLKGLLQSKGFTIKEAQSYKALEVKDINLNNPGSNFEMTSEGFFVTDPTNGVRHQVFLYMKEYRVSYYNQYPVYHICNCQTLQKYSHAYYRRANTACVPVRDRDTGEEVMVNHLKLCQNCSNMLKGAPKTTEEFEEIMRAAAENDIQEEELDLYGYVKNWRQISEAYRNLIKYTCENCGICITDPFDIHFIQVHHISGNKTDNRKENLKCLCIECHSQVNDTHRKNFQSQAQQQLISDFIKKYRRY